MIRDRGKTYSDVDTPVGTESVTSDIGTAAPTGSTAERPVVRIWVFVGILMLVALLKLPTLTQPPVWDGSFSVFPAAATLVDNGFDYPGLLDEPGYREGGPNVHALSLVTVITAIAIRTLGDNALPVLHLVNYAIAAATGLGLYLIGRRALSLRLALVSAVAGVVAPVVITSAGDVYLELPILAATVWASVAFLNDRRGVATGWAVLGVLIKQSGIIVGAALALATLSDPRRAQRSLRMAATVVAAPTATLLLLSALGPSNAVEIPFGELIVSTFTNSTKFMLRIPDVVALLFLFLALYPAVSDRPLAGGGSNNEVRRIETVIRSLLLSFAVFHVVAGGLAFATLPRYWSQVTPFIVLGVAFGVRRLASERIVFNLGVSLCVVFVVNINGLLYPAVGQNNFPVAERSGEYRRLLDVQLAVAAAIEALPDDVPVFYTQAHHYWVTYPTSGYVTQPVPNGINVAVDPRADDPHLVEFPDDFYVAFESAALGGRALADIHEQAQRDPRYATEVIEFRSGEFWSVLVRITRTS